MRTPTFSVFEWIFSTGPAQKNHFGEIQVKYFLKTHVETLKGRNIKGQWVDIKYMLRYGLICLEHKFCFRL